MHDYWQTYFFKNEHFWLKATQFLFRIEIDASDNNNTTALHYAAKYDIVVLVVMVVQKRTNYKIKLKIINVLGKGMVISYSSW